MGEGSRNEGGRAGSASLLRVDGLARVGEGRRGDGGCVGGLWGDDLDDLRAENGRRKEAEIIIAREEAAMRGQGSDT